MTPSDETRERVTGAAIVEALHRLPRVRIPASWCIGCGERWDDDHDVKHAIIAAKYPDEITIYSRQDIFSITPDKDAETALIDAALTLARTEATAQERARASERIQSWAFNQKCEGLTERVTDEQGRVSGGEAQLYAWGLLMNLAAAILAPPETTS